MGDDDIILESEDGEGDASEKKLKKLREELKKAKKESAEHLAGWQRSKADYINLSRRVREESEVSARIQTAQLTQRVIAVLDSLEAAQRGLSDSAETLAALTPIEKQLQDALREFNVSTYTPEPGSPFNPTRHEPIQTVATEDENEDNIISETFQSGYEVDGVVIRPARVKVLQYQPNR